MGNALQSLETQYFFLSQNLPILLAACQTQEQRDAVNTQYVTARRNYWNCIHQIFHDDDPAVAKLVAQMRSAEKDLEKAVNQLNDVGKVMDAITAAVTVGSNLVELAG